MLSAHGDNAGHWVIVQSLGRKSGSTIAALRPPMEASGLEMCIAGEMAIVEVDVGFGGAILGPPWLVQTCISTWPSSKLT